MTDVDFRIDVLLATRRPAPSRAQDWGARHAALWRAKRMTDDVATLAHLQGELVAMEADRDAYWGAKRELEAEDARSMDTCPLRPLDHGPGHCDGCAGELPVGRRRWCSDACASRWWANHAWGSARWLAIVRSSGFTVEQLQELRQPLYSMAFCDACGKYTSSPEVNHVDPRAGRGYGPGCHHHQSNLVVLCHDCHLVETALQRADRACGFELVAPLDVAEAAVVQPVRLPALPPAAIAIEYGSTLGIPSAGAWDVAS